MAECQKQMRLDGKPYPRTCQVCGLGPCVMQPRETPGVTHVDGLVDEMAAALTEHKWELTRRLRWYRPPGGNDTELRLQQLWRRLWSRDGTVEWRDVPTAD